MIYAIAAYAGLTTVAILVLALKLASSLRDQRELVATALASGKNQLEAERAAANAIKQRDDLHASKVELEVAAAKSMRAFLDLEVRYNELLKKEAEHAVEKVRDAPTTADAAAALSDLVSSPLPGEPSADGDATDPATPASGGLNTTLL